MTPAELLRKASRSLFSAKALFDLGDMGGACNRAYYAMFDAAQAALIVSNASTEQTFIKTHSGLIAAFSNQLIKTGELPVELGKTLNHTHRIRLLADYTGEEITEETARKILDQANHFVATTQQYITGS